MEPSAHIDLKSSAAKGKITGLWRLMSGYRGIYLAAILSVGLAALSQTGLYVLLGKFVDEILPSENMGQLLPLAIAGLLLLALFQGGFTFLGGRLAAKTAEGVARRLRNYLYNHLQRLSFSQNDRLQTGDLLQRATSDVDTVRRMFAEQIIGIGRISLLFIVNFTAIALIDGRLALISVAFIPVILGVSLFFFVKMGQVYETFQEQEARLSNQLQENLTGARVVKAFARQDYEKEAFAVENKEKYRRGRKLILMHAIYWPATDMLAGAQMVLGFYVAAVMALNGAFAVGTYIAYAGFLVALIWPIRNLGRLIADVSTGFVSFGRIQKIIRLEEEPLHEGVYPEWPLRGEIIFDHVSFAYDGEESEALHNISFTVRPGQKIALMGGTGAGKTSLVNLLPRFYDYSDGRILLDGAELTTYSRDYLRQQIGIVMQEPFLFSTTIRQNITYGVTREVTDEEVYAAARAAAVHDVILSFPEGYDTLVGERGVTLSGGQKQRITLARTILRDPSLLILDDATSAVDTETAEIIRNALDKLMQNRTTFLIAHRVQSVMDADLILVLEHGRIAQSGTHAELVNQPGIYRRIYNLQSRIETELEVEIGELEIGDWELIPNL